jgi:hypothetical protein
MKGKCVRMIAVVATLVGVLSSHSKRFGDSGGWGWPQGSDAKCATRR